MTIVTKHCFVPKPNAGLILGIDLVPAYLKFEINSSFVDTVIVDLTSADDKSFRDINYRLELAGQKYKDNMIKKSLSLGTVSQPTESDINGIRKEIELWVFNTYMKLLSEQIFLPLDNSDDKKLLYAPFQCLAQYFISKGFGGIIYKSTMLPGGKNIVFF